MRSRFPWSSSCAVLMQVVLAALSCLCRTSKPCYRQSRPPLLLAVLRVLHGLRELHKPLPA